MNVLHVTNEGSVGGGTIHVAQSIRDLVKLGHRAGLATLSDGPICERIRGWGGGVYVMDREEDLFKVCADFEPVILHAHSCGGECWTIDLGSVMQAQGDKLCIGGHVHSMVAGDNPLADFEIAEVEMMRQLRPRITIIPWSYDLSRLQSDLTKEEAKAKYGIPEGAFVIGRNGRLDGAKRPDFFIRILAACPPDVYGVISGGGPEYGKLFDLADELNCRGRLIFAGPCLDPGDRFAAMDLVVYPTQDESWCAGIIEPMLIGKPVVANLVGGMGENLIAGNTGYVASTIEEFVTTVTQVRENYLEALSLAANGSAHLEAKGVHDPVLEARRHLALYEEVYKKRFRKLPR